MLYVPLLVDDHACQDAMRIEVATSILRALRAAKDVRRGHEVDSGFSNPDKRIRLRRGVRRWNVDEFDGGKRRGASGEQRKGARNDRFGAPHSQPPRQAGCVLYSGPVQLAAYMRVVIRGGGALARAVTPPLGRAHVCARVVRRSLRDSVRWYPVFETGRHSAALLTSEYHRPRLGHAVIGRSPWT